MKVEFILDKEKDLKNIWDTCNANPVSGCNWKNCVTENIYQMCHNKKYSECKKPLKKIIDSIYEKEILPQIANSFSKTWKKISKQYFTRLKKIIGVKNLNIKFSKINGYLTGSARCPYEPNKKNPSFFVNFFWGIPNVLQTAGHEIMHIYFHNSKYWDLCKKEIGYDKTHNLKESLTELLNLEFRDLWIVENLGYPNHKHLMKFINKQWKKKKDFEILINKSIKWIKKNGIK